MGCMEILPGIISKGYLDHCPEGGTHIIPDLVPDVEPLPMVCYKGDVILMHRFTPHRGNLTFQSHAVGQLIYDTNRPVSTLAVLDIRRLLFAVQAIPTMY